MIFLYSIMMIAFLVMMIGAVVSAAFPAAKSIEEAGRNNVKKYRIAIIKEELRKRGGE